MIIITGWVWSLWTFYLFQVYGEVKVSAKAHVFKSKKHSRVQFMNKKGMKNSLIGGPLTYMKRYPSQPAS